jgi:hypothetical protein
MSMHTTEWGFAFTLTTPDEMSEGKRRPVAYKLVEVFEKFPDEEALPADPDAAVAEVAKPAKDDDFGPDLMRELDELNDLVAVGLLLSWSNEAPISLEALQALPSRDYRAIREKVAPFATQMLPDFSPTPEAGTPTTP